MHVMDPAGVVASAKLAATTAPVAARSMVRQAMQDFAWTAARGTPVPLPVLLDANVIMASARSPRPRFKPVPRRGEDHLAYDEWLQLFSNTVPAYLGVLEHGTDPRDAPIRWNVAPLLGRIWGGDSEVGPTATTSSHRFLDGDTTVEEVCRLWAGPRDADLGHWQRWFKRRPRTLLTDPIGGFWSLSATLRGLDWLDERFDHEAARMYLDSMDPAPGLAQERRILRLLRRRRITEGSPFATSYEEPSAFSGAVALSTLCSGEEGLLKYVNRSDPRFASPPPAEPPGDLEVHLCWALGSSSMERAGPAPAYAARGEPPAQARAAGSSWLQGLAALLLDDWRSALRILDVEFFAHCGEPDSQTDAFGPGGPRWKEAARWRGPLPRPGFVTRFFERCDWVSLASRALRWRQSPALRSWWGLVLLRSDLEEFGLKPLPSPWHSHEGGWSAPTESLPDCIHTVFIVEPPKGNGAIYVTSRAGRDGDIELHPRYVYRNSSDRLDPGFQSFRLLALDAVLDALEQLD